MANTTKMKTTKMKKTKKAKVDAVELWNDPAIAELLFMYLKANLNAQDQTQSKKKIIEEVVEGIHDDIDNLIKYDERAAEFEYAIKEAIYDEAEQVVKKGK